MSLLMDNERLDTPDARDKMFDVLWDTSSLLCAGFYRTSMSRRSRVISSFKGKYKQLAVRSKVGSAYLFDGKAEGWVRRAQDASRAAKMVYKPSQTLPTGRFETTTAQPSTSFTYKKPTQNPGNAQRSAVKNPQPKTAFKGQHQGRRGDYNNRHRHRN
uniref:CUE domain-containing protein 3 n=2 Tax=Lygus hesperus TaxID=30085 RepID=A0A0A9ZC23_LYGHE